MDLPSLINKIRSGETLSKEDREHLLRLLETEFRTLREKDPRAYLDLLTFMVDTVRKASRGLSALAS